MKIILTAVILTALLSGCLSVPESNRASEETAWELSDQLTDQAGLTVAVGVFDTTDVPESLEATFRNDLSTTLAIAFRETGQDHKVVTRDKVDQVFTEQTMALEGLTYQESQMRIGQILGADVLVVGTIIWLEDDLYRSSAQIIETETGVVVGGSSWDFWFDTESDD
jgi:curli biogenesis system outer membrane secretion channel CsgG